MNFHCPRGHIKTNIRILNKYAALKNKNTNRNPSRNIPRGTSNPKVNMNDVEIDWVVGWISPLIHRSYSDHNIRRYRDNNELLYSLRTIYLYAPWIRTIHIILGNYSKPPVWLKEHPKIHLVNEHDLYTPVQPNSETKKLFYHQIPNLAPYFISSDDDMFLIKPLRKGELFCNRIPILNSVGFAAPPPNLERRPFRKSSDGPGHVPLIWNRNSYGGAANHINKKLYLTMGSKRYNPWIYFKQYLQKRKHICNGRITSPYVWINDSTVNSMQTLLTNLIKNTLLNSLRGNSFMCINDDFSSVPALYNRQYSFLQVALSTLFPKKAPWEQEKIADIENLNLTYRPIFQLQTGPNNRPIKKINLNPQLSHKQLTIKTTSPRLQSVFRLTIRNNVLTIARIDRTTGWNFRFNITVTVAPNNETSDSKKD